jgi:dUTPase
VEWQISEADCYSVQKSVITIILDIDAINNLGTTYLSRTKGFIFQHHLYQKDFQKANLKTISTLKTRAHTGIPARLGTTLGNNQEPMPGGVQAVSTIASMEFPYLFAQTGLVSPDYQGQLLIILQNCGDKDVILPRGSIIGFIANVKYPNFDEISEVKQKKWEAKVSANAKLPEPEPMLHEEKEFD